ncbi:MAG: hypothetical protein QOD59_3667, partial [Mycobacterium sp.]|nr:hypothetical protein [Mycobacterium sp.]
AHGPIFDPDALARRAQNLPEKPKRTITTPSRGLTGPDPSGMTFEGVVALGEAEAGWIG